MASSRYRKKPIVIEAEQVDFAKISCPDGVVLNLDSGDWEIDTLEGVHKVSDGDWIITGVKGEKYPCKPDIFEMTYDEVGDGE